MGHTLLPWHLVSCFCCELSRVFGAGSLMTLGEVQLVGANGASKTHYALKHLFIDSFGYFCFYLPHQVLHGAA